ncbi:glycosyl hydrolase [Streptomyces sp. NPDC054808]
MSPQHASRRTVLRRAAGTAAILAVPGTAAVAANAVAGETAAPRRPRPRAAGPVAPGANQQAVNLLAFVAAQYRHKIIAGQQESTWIAGPDYEMNYIHDHTGTYPAIRGLDICDAPGGATERAIAWWQAGGIPMFGYHMGAPTYSDDYDGSKQTVSIDKVLTPGTAEYTSFVERLDNAAAQMHELREAGAAAIWRPFHEAGGTWFWWSKEGGAQYQRLWKFAFDRFAEKKVTNAVWLMGFNGEPAASAACYPGKDYVDIAGADTYAGDQNYDPQKAMYDATTGVVGPSIPVALHENGPIPDPDRLVTSGADWVLFNTWNVEHLTKSNTVEHLAKVYSHDHVVTRDQVPDLN